MKIGDHVEVVSGPHWVGITGKIVRWGWTFDEVSNRPIPGEDKAEIMMDERHRGKFTGPAISVVVAKLKHLSKRSP